MKKKGIGEWELGGFKYSIAATVGKCLQLELQVRSCQVKQAATSWSKGSGVAIGVGKVP